ncbi:hypothetical protein AG1IA_05658 [Rhizoctonia solani AG-1 IA]|uniref:Uncharacterized protein n=1 Tax=Thanatephorus cucumeris (strain AG1-IA) TaxID=983506 RepID=L8WQR5_THACA|nr:hypothetical protein AG1IA_05658 [Rhizoctonia solani AG-1 IA]
MSVNHRSPNWGSPVSHDCVIIQLSLLVRLPRLEGRRSMFTEASDSGLPDGEVEKWSCPLPSISGRGSEAKVLPVSKRMIAKDTTCTISTPQAIRNTLDQFWLDRLSPAMRQIEAPF